MKNLAEYKKTAMKDEEFSCCYKLVLLKELIEAKIKENYEIANECFERDILAAIDMFKENDALEFVLLLIETIDKGGK